MERLALTASNTQEVAQRAAGVLRAGGVVLYPTDTLYGLGSDALSDEAVAKIYAIKGRHDHKPMHAIVADIAMAERFGEVDGRVRGMLQRLPPGKVSLVVRKKAMNSGITKGSATFGFRIPDHALCIAMARQFGGPITATSANTADAEPQRTIDAILEQLGDAGSSIDLVIDAGKLPKREPSSVVELTATDLIVLREGAVPAADIRSALSGRS